MVSKIGCCLLFLLINIYAGLCSDDSKCLDLYVDIEFGEVTTSHDRFLM